MILILLALVISIEHVHGEINSLPLGITLPPGFTFPPDFTLPDLEDLPDDYIAVHQALIIPRGTNINSDITPLCNGILLLNFTVLTAASCLMKNSEQFYESTELSVALGFFSIENVISVQPQSFEVRSVTIHGRFNKQSRVNNIALLKLNGNVEISASIIPILPSESRVWSHGECQLLGWSNFKTDVINTTTISPKNCNSNWPWDKFCTSKSNDENLDSCLADEGSALICDGMLQGIVSSTCDGSTTALTDVNLFYYWLILNQLDENPYKLVDNETLRKFLFGAFDFVAWTFGDPKLADYFELLKFFF